MPRYEVRFWVDAENRESIEDALCNAFPYSGAVIRDITPMQELEEDRNNEPD